MALITPNLLTEVVWRTYYLRTTENGYKKEKAGNMLEDNCLSRMRESASSNGDQEKKNSNDRAIFQSEDTLLS